MMFATLLVATSFSQDRKISDLTLKASFSGTEDIPINDGGTNKRIKTSLFLSSNYGGLTGLTSGRIPVASGATSLTTYSTLLYDGTGPVTIGSGTSPITPKNLLSLHSSSASSGAILGGIFYVDQTVATSGSAQGTEGYVKTSNATGSVTLSIGTIGNLEHSGAGTLATARSIQGGGVLSGNGTITSLSGLYSTYAITGAGTITTYYGAYLDAPSAGSGTITNRYGLYSADANAINYFAGSLRMNSISQDDALTQMIVRDAGTGQLKYRASSTFMSGSVASPAIPYASSSNVFAASNLYHGTHGLGFGAAPSGGTTSYYVIELGTGLGVIGSKTGSAGSIFANLYYDGDYKYESSGHGNELGMSSGNFLFRTAPSGTVDNTATMTTRFQIGNTGTITINTAPTNDNTNTALLSRDVTTGEIETVAASTFQASDTELTALAGTTSAADKVPYYTGSGTASTATMTPFARTLIDDADAATARATLGISATSGTYTPTFTSTSNVDSYNVFPCQYSRTGDVVTVSGRIRINATAASTTSGDISLPVSTSFTNGTSDEGGGTINSASGQGYGGIHSKQNTGVATVTVVPSATSDIDYYFVFVYQVL